MKSNSQLGISCIYKTICLLLPGAVCICSLKSCSARLVSTSIPNNTFPHFHFLNVIRVYICERALHAHAHSVAAEQRDDDDDHISLCFSCSFAPFYYRLNSFRVTPCNWRNFATKCSEPALFSVFMKRYVFRAHHQPIFSVRMCVFVCNVQCTHIFLTSFTPKNCLHRRTNGNQEPHV